MLGDSKKDNLKRMRSVGPYLGLGTQLALTIVALFFLGYWIDQKLGLLPLFTLIFSFVGGFGGIYNFIKSVIQINEKGKEKH